ncbi:hypothetical protein C8F04DRAFT_1070937 [Mycena alexandri]|uniref:F-box domain-containing protein n=1 Tax=Mycena alexandri TaxID=1745969 RepID=A0AAD6TEV4_9AGAR|nr:hypothetical protein C8F04DRAFT_1070937 [Mycena alexandri]
MPRGIHSQPDEILAQIFKEHVEWADEDILHVADGPWFLSHVCRSWRMTVLDHPELWSIVRVAQPDMFDSDAYIGDSDSDEEIDSEDSASEYGGLSSHNSARNALLLLNLALERSQNYPLEVKLEFDTAVDDVATASLRHMGVKDSSTSLLPHRLIRAVVAHSNRWKKVDLQIAAGFMPLFAPIQNRLSLLTNFTLATFGDSAPPFLYAQNAPSLATVTLVEYSHEIVPVPWESIRHFSETQIMPRRAAANVVDRFLRLLRQNPNLEVLEVSYPSMAPSQSSLTHRSLRRLTINEGNLIRCLTLPRLEQLTAEVDNDTAAAIRDLLKRSKCSLRHLHLIDFTLDEDVLAILSGSTKLHTLILRLTGWNPRVKKTMELLVKKLAEPSFLPGLEDLDIIISQEHEFDPEPMSSPCQITFINDAFVDMLAGRWGRRLAPKGGAYLKTVFVLVELPSTVGLSKTRGVARLQKLCDEGMDLFVRARDPRALDLREAAKDISYVYKDIAV